MAGSVCLDVDRAVVPMRRRYRRRVLSWHLRGRRQASAHLLPFEWSGPPLSARGGGRSEASGSFVSHGKTPNKALQATAAVLCGWELALRHNAEVAGASALPAAVPELGR